MPRNGSGTYTLPQAAFVAGTVISSAAVNSDFSDIATALTGSLPRDGQAGMSGQLKATDGSPIAPSITFNNEPNTGFSRAATGQIGVSILGTQIGTFSASGWSKDIPVGAVLDFAGSAAPTFWLLCYGQNVSRTTYALLFAAIGTTYGSGDGSTTFGLPDLRGVAIYGKANMGGTPTTKLTSTYFGTDPTVVGNFGGSQSRVLLTANLPAYTPAGLVAITELPHTHGIGIGSAGTSTAGSFPPAPGVVRSGTGNSDPATTGSTAAFAGTPQGGTATAFASLAPGIIMNKIIYAGA